MFISSDGPAPDTAAEYRAFARLEARGRSAQYEALAMQVAAEPAVLAFLDALPPAKRQPNLLFAAARYLLGHPPGLAELRSLVSDRRTELAGLMLARRTQTNEPRRCTALLPALMLLPQPLALLEVGASAGLNLLPDRYSYDYGGHRVTGTDPQAPLLRCQPQGPVPLPRAVPEVCWRAGLDLSPLDVRSDGDVRWLECLLWPGEEGRAEVLAAAVAAARRDPPRVERGDLLTALPALAAQAPAGATLVIYHTAVLAYVSPAARRRFASLMRALPAVWLCGEVPGVLPGVPVPAHAGVAYVLARDGQVPFALADMHGAWLRWLD